jgi:hypothetical protein
LVKIVKGIGRLYIFISGGREGRFLCPIFVAIDNLAKELIESVLVFHDDGGINFIVQFIDEMARLITSCKLMSNAIQQEELASHILSCQSNLCIYLRVDEYFEGASCASAACLYQLSSLEDMRGPDYLHLL